VSPGRGSRCSPIGAGLACLALLLTGPVTAQEPDAGVDEVRLLRVASAREAAGDLAGAEAAFRRLLEDRPTSVPGLLGLERVLRARDRLDAVLPVLDRFLAVAPGSAIGHRLRVRALDDLDRPTELEAAGEAWTDAVPGEPGPYLALARVWRGRGRTDRAIELLERGRRVVEDASLDVELGDLYAGTGRYDAALRAWDRAIGSQAVAYPKVRDRLMALPDGGAVMIPALLDRLTRADPTPARRKAAVDLAMQVGRAAYARDEAGRLAAELAADDRRVFLTGVAASADRHGLDSLAYWAYRELLRSGALDDDPVVRSRIAELALALGDTAVARESYRAVASAFRPGAPERRRAGVLRVRLLIGERELERAASALAGLREEFPDAPQVDSVTADLAAVYLARGDTAPAAALVAGSRGARAGLLRGRLALARGDAEAAREAFMEVAPRLEGPVATDALALAGLLGTISPEAAAVLGVAVPVAGAVPTGTAGRIAGAVDTLPEADRAPLLAYAATLADQAGETDAATRIRRRVVASFPDADEAPGALLELARSLADGDPAEAGTLLERLILEYPSNPLVPQARRELSLLRGRVPPREGSVP